MKTKIREWLNSESFDSVCYNYRSKPGSQPHNVVAAFEVLKDHIEEKFNELTEGIKNE